MIYGGKSTRLDIVPSGNAIAYALVEADSFFTDPGGFFCPANAWNGDWRLCWRRMSPAIAG
jgi:hypothetical protein